MYSLFIGIKLYLTVYIIEIKIEKCNWKFDNINFFQSTLNASKVKF